MEKALPAPGRGRSAFAGSDSCIIDPCRRPVKKKSAARPLFCQMHKLFPVCAPSVGQDAPFPARALDNPGGGWYPAFYGQRRPRADRPSLRGRGLLLPFGCPEFLVDLQRTVPVGVGEQPGDVAEIHHGEMGLALFFPQAGAPPKDLLELGH